METYRFKTNLKCNGCINTIKPGIESLSSIQGWSVDLEKPEKILEIQSAADISDQVIETIKKAGFEISRL